jgi:hypothetical protein
MKHLGSHPLRYPDRQRGPWVLTFHLAEHEGRVECVGLDVRAFVERASRRTKPPGADDAEPLTATFLRSLPVASLIAEAIHDSADVRRWVASGAAPGATTQAEREAGRQAATLERQPGRRTQWTPERLAEVAAVYREALAVKGRPTQAVAERFSLSASMAAKLVRRCREQGLLGPTQQGKAGG